MLTIIGLTAAVVLLFFNLLFFIAIIKKDNSIVDIGWGIGFVLIAWFTLLSFGEWNLRQTIVTALVTAWGARLATHIYLRNKGKSEDWRYKQWREEWGKWFIPRTYLQVFLLQAALMLIVSVPIIHVNSTASVGASWVILVGMLLWIFGFYFEGLADYQLSLHIKSKKKGLLTNGVWGLTRHPNYFGEAVQWWGIGIISIASIPGFVLYQNGCGLLTLVGPLTITFLLRFVSGVPLLEKRMAKKKGFKEYAKTTPIFVPWPWNVK